MSPPFCIITMKHDEQTALLISCLYRRDKHVLFVMFSEDVFCSGGRFSRISAFGMGVNSRLKDEARRFDVNKTQKLSVKL